MLENIKAMAPVVLNALIENSQESIFITDGAGKVIIINDVAANLLNTNRDEVIGKTVDHLVEKGLWENSAVLKAIDGKTQSTVIINPKKKEKIVSICTPIFDDDGNIILTITNSNNETTLRALIKQIDAERKKVSKYKEELDYIRKNESIDIIADSLSMKHVLRQTNVVSETDTTVVLYGESGTGKDVLATLIHNNSKRCDNPFISVNCAAIPETLIESELFGYEKGSFTGADAKGKKGLFEIANGGTIFLDEIGEIPLVFQTKLLRALENNEIRRVGGTENIKLDVRIVCATNKDLMKMVECGDFRDDLYYRFNVFPITLRPLREREEDIIPLAKKFLEDLNRKYNTDKTLNDEFKDSLLHYTWPGNIRELRNLIERAYIVSGDELNIRIEESTKMEEQNSRLEEETLITGDVCDLKSYMSKVEKRYIESVLEITNGNVMKAAELLDTHRSVIYRKLKK